METRLELYREAGMGSGQIDVEELPDFIEPSADLIEHDMPLLIEVGAMDSFDPYSLRRGLRHAGIAVEDEAAYALSDAKRRELAPHMRNLTRPLIQYLYGADNVEMSDPRLLRERLSNLDSAAVRDKLYRLADALGTSPEGLPDMLEDYGDVFLSLGYYRSYLDLIEPRVATLVEWLRDTARSPYVRVDPITALGLSNTEKTILWLIRSVRKRFENFDKRTAIRWDRVTVGTFNQVRDLIIDHQASLGAVLCGLAVKIYEWDERFANRGGNMERRAEFIMSDLRAGLDRLADIEREAPSFA